MIDSSGVALCCRT